MKLCLDEHYAKRIAVELRDRHGRDVVCVKERPDLVTLTDRELLEVMQAEGRAFLTENVQDFDPLVRQTIAAGGSHSGVVYASPRSMPRSRATIGAFVDALDALMRRHPRERDFVDRIEWLSPPARAGIS